MTNNDKSMAVFCDFENVALGVREAKYDRFDIGKQHRGAVRRDDTEKQAFPVGHQCVAFRPLGIGQRFGDNYGGG